MIRQLKNRKLSPTRIRTLRFMRKIGWGLRPLAQIAGVSEGTLSLALRGKTYAEVDPDKRDPGRAETNRRKLAEKNRRWDAR